MTEKNALSLIKSLLDDAEVTEIMIDNHEKIYIERQGKLEDVPSPFQYEAQVYELIGALTKPLGVVVNEARPYVDLRLPDHSLVNIVIPPIALTGPSVTIRKYAQHRITLEDLLTWKCVSQEMVDFIRACVLARVNIIVSGGVASGKMTLLGIIARMIPPDERLVVVQTQWVDLDHKRLVRLEGRPPNTQGQGEITMSDLVENAKRMRPDRIIINELNGGEALAVLGSMNTGHDGGMASLHSNGPRDTLSRLEMMASMGNPSIPLLAIREQLASAIDLIIHQERLRDGTRKIVSISEVTGMSEGVVTLADIFQFQMTGYENGRVLGVHKATGIIPKFMPVLQDMGVSLDLFTPK